MNTMMRFKTVLAQIIAFLFLATFGTAQESADSWIAIIDESSSVREIAKVLKDASPPEISLSTSIEVRLHGLSVLDLKSKTKPTEGKKDERVQAIELYWNYRERLHGNFQDLSASLRSDKPNSLDLVKAQFQFARFLETHKPRPTGPRNKKEIAKEKSQIETLYLESVSISRNLGPDGRHLNVVVEVFLGDLYMATGKFEEAMPFYLNFVDGLTKLKGNKSPELVRGLVPLTQYYEMVGDLERFENAKARLSLLKYNYSENDSINITSRALDGQKGIDEIAGRISGASYTNIAPNARRLGDRIEAERGYQTHSSSMAGGMPAAVVVSADGNVRSVTVLSGSQRQRTKAENIVKTWKFRPLIYEGSPVEIKGIVYCWIKD